jgi:hypothetical protein
VDNVQTVKSLINRPIAPVISYSIVAAQLSILCFTTFSLGLIIRRGAIETGREVGIANYFFTMAGVAIVGILWLILNWRKARRTDNIAN